MIYIAHQNEENGEIQTVEEHNLHTAELAREFCISEFAEFAFLIGIHHDDGKYRPSFQQKIRGFSSARAEHSICGAKVLESDCSDLCEPLRRMLQDCIAGHHSGLPDYGTRASKDTSELLARLKQEVDPCEYAAYKEDCAGYIPDFQRLNEVFKNFMYQDTIGDQAHREEDRILMTDKYAFLTRYLFSCLTDADSVDTVAFCQGEKMRG